MELNHIRNFCIIAHIDHGKSTLADRFLEITGTVAKNKIHKQYLDLMDLEQERGITIKLTPVRMDWKHPDTGEQFLLNLIDTPGDVDFTYEVSRSLAACQGAVVVVDATQGIEAQTLANVYLALEQDLVLIPVINKIDLPSAQVDRVKREMLKVFGFKENEILAVSAKTGEGVEQLLKEIITLVPHPEAEIDQPPRALIFDSKYDSYKGGVAYVCVIDGEFKRADKIFMLGERTEAEILEIGVFKPQMVPIEKLSAGEVGYIATGLKDTAGLRVGDTITKHGLIGVTGLHGYKRVIPKVFAGIYPVNSEEYPDLKEAMDRLSLNDSSLSFEPETSAALGFGFRCGFLGLLHMDIIHERLEREYDLDLIFTAPNVEYWVLIQGAYTQGTLNDPQADELIAQCSKEIRWDDRLEGYGFVLVRNPSEFPEEIKIEQVLEPWVKLSIICPSEYIGGIMDLVKKHRGDFMPTEFIDDERVNLHFEVPLSEIIVDFYDSLKSISSGYASMDYELCGLRPGNLQKLKVLVHEKEVDAFAQIVPRERSLFLAREIVDKLKDAIPRQMFEFKIQAQLGAKVIATVRRGATRKDVTAKLYGGDRTRKEKLLKKQKKGKKRMKMIGQVEVPQEAFFTVMRKS